MVGRYTAYEVAARKMPFTTRGYVTKAEAFTLAACAGRNLRQADIDTHWPPGEASIDLRYAMEILEICPDITIRKIRGGSMPQEYINHKLLMMDLDAYERLDIERFVKIFENPETGTFSVDEFWRHIDIDRQIFLDTLNTHFNKERDPISSGSSAGRDVYSIDSGSEEEVNMETKAPVAKQESEDSMKKDLFDRAEAEEGEEGRSTALESENGEEGIQHPGPLQAFENAGFLALTNGPSCVQTRVEVTDPEGAAVELVFTIRKSDSDYLLDGVFKYNLIGYVVDENTQELLYITTKFARFDGVDGLSFSTGMHHYNPGRYHFAVMRFFEYPNMEFSEQTRLVRELIVDVDRPKAKITTRLRMLLMSMFDYFDIDMDSILSRAEYEMFAEIEEGGREEAEEEMWKLLSETTKFDVNVGMNINAFIGLHNIFVNASVNDLWKNLRNLGVGVVDGALKIIRLCPYKTTVRAHGAIRLGTGHEAVPEEVAHTLPYHMYDKGTELTEFVLSTGTREYSKYWRLFKVDYYAALICRKHSSSPPTFLVNVKGSTNSRVHWLVDVSGGLTIDAGERSRLLVAVFFPIGPNWNFSIELTRKA